MLRTAIVGEVFSHTPAQELKKVFISARTTYGEIACCHLSAVKNQSHLLIAHQQIFDSHSITMGDMNATWNRIVGEAGQLGSVNHDTHESVNMPSYLPCTLSNTNAVMPPAFDQIIIRHGRVNPEHRPQLYGTLAPKQVARLQLIRHDPRKVIISRHDILSDHVSVEANVFNDEDMSIRCATWNVADPFYFARFWPNAANRFVSADEERRQESIRQQVRILLNHCDVVALQEVPARLVPYIRTDAENAGFGLRKERMKPSDQDLNPDSSTIPAMMLFVKSEMANEPLNTVIDCDDKLQIIRPKTPDTWEELIEN